MRLFCIWNGAFKPQYVLAESIDEAITTAIANGHMRKRTGIRKWQEFTEDDEGDLPGVKSVLEAGEAASSH